MMPLVGIWAYGHFIRDLTALLADEFCPKKHSLQVKESHDFLNPCYASMRLSTASSIIEYPQDMLANYIERLMNKCLDELIRSGCIELKEAQQAPQGAAVKKKSPKGEKLFWGWQLMTQIDHRNELI